MSVGFRRRCGVQTSPCHIRHWTVGNKSTKEQKETTVRKSYVSFFHGMYCTISHGENELNCYGANGKNCSLPLDRVRVSRHAVAPCLNLNDGFGRIYLFSLW